jgi:uncharacterized protein (DUF305 family)
MKPMSYSKLAIMICISFVIMYSVMFLNVDETNHIYLSTTRFYMAVLMVAPMQVIMMLFMGHMYPSKKSNTLIMIASAVAFLAALIGLRQQLPIDDTQYMKAMIPHHSSAIMTSRHANIKDPEVKRLSEQIIKSQEEEIAEMKRVLARLN